MTRKGQTRTKEVLILVAAMSGLGNLVGCASFADSDSGDGWNSNGTTQSPSGSGGSSASASPGAGSADAGVFNGNVGGLTGASGGAPGGPSNTGGTPQKPASVAATTNPFISPAYDPFSTFAIDVDTASYDIFRREVNFGRLPQTSQVRLEEYVNAFSYEYPAPAATSDIPFSVGIKAAVSPFASGTTLLRVSLQGKQITAVEKKPTNLVYLIDVSGSMGVPEKLPLVKQVASESLDLLAPTDKVSIVVYSGTTAVKLTATPASEKAKIRGVIDSLAAAGSTAGGSGIMLAYEQAQAAFIVGGINHVLLCTDGDFNLGITNNDELVKLIETKRKTGVTLTALGFGNDVQNDAMMERVSNAGDGIYAVISSRDQATTYVRDSLLSTIVHIAKDVKIQVEFNPQRVSAYRLLGYENRDIADSNFRNDRVDAGEIGAGLRVTALYEVALLGASVPMPVGAPELKSGLPVPGTREVLATDLAMVKVRFKAPGAKETDPAREVSSHLGVDEVLQTLAAADADMQWAAALGAFAEILKDSPYANKANLSTIASIVESQKARDAGRTEFAALFAKAQPLIR